VNHYRFLNATPEQVKEEWRPTAGEPANFSGGLCVVKAIVCFEAWIDQRGHNYIVSTSTLSEPLPLDPPAAPAWKPEVGQECLCKPHPEATEYRAVYIGEDPEGRAVVQDPGTALYHGCDFKWLRPLPPEVPVKLDDYVEVKRDGETWFGIVAEVHSDSCMFRLAGYLLWFHWTAPSTKIQRFRPVESVPMTILLAGRRG